MATEQQLDSAAEYARDLGEQHGRSAAEWYAQDTFGGRVVRGAEDAARRILAGIEEGDPEILDSFPYADLSGEWAGSLTGPELVSDALAEADVDEDDPAALDAFSDICDEYESAYNTAAEDEIARLARYHLGITD